MLPSVRAVVLFTLASLVHGAPLQCRGEPDHELRRNETPDEALYVLAESFRAQKDEAAWRATLEHLIERYPNGRFAARARQDLGKAP
jgi:hypothetical protein